MVKIKIKTHPGSSREKIVKISEDNYEIWIKEKPLDGKANAYLEKFLKKEFKKPVKIISGLSSRNKIAEISG